MYTKSLTVICDTTSDDGTGGCNGAHIMCPMIQGYTTSARCSVSCLNNNLRSIRDGSEPGACQDVIVSQAVNPNLYSLDIECRGSHACRGLSTTCPVYPTDMEHECKINCNAHKDEYGSSVNTCSEMTVAKAYNYGHVGRDWVDISCGVGQCDALRFQCGHPSSYGQKLTYNTTALVKDGSYYYCADNMCCPLPFDMDVWGSLLVDIDEMEGLPSTTGESESAAPTSGNVDTTVAVSGAATSVDGTSTVTTAAVTDILSTTGVVRVADIYIYESEAARDGSRYAVDPLLIVLVVALVILCGVVAYLSFRLQRVKKQQATNELNEQLVTVSDQEV
eukprot:CAMPEP_0202714070 /NCGR_PEP_ID=MMETSP1385-20130828/62309_1 /ASSEMBLY_ACC=CAM_ASM_000861 /TAXON_ID=933848 /ORGANISM="Elphidium margaritaceum" /LENGTH=333 /DNA_ID=CAMNT_0049374637 /DNA_START=198 /DNA_END=1199 /DNA_ORIENTATION=+